MTAALIRGDAIRLPLRDESVDLVCTSPPYFALRSYQDGGEHYDGQIGSEPTPQAFIDALVAVTAECRRVLKPSGSMFVNLGDKYAGGGGQWDKDERGDRKHTRGSVATGGRTFGFQSKSLMLLPERYRIACVDQLGLIARAIIIWDKPNGLPESVTDRVRRSHEDWVHLTKQPRYYAAVDEIREPYAPGMAERVATYSDRPSAPRHREGNGDGACGNLGFAGNPNPLGKLPGSVWTVPSEPLRVPEYVGVDHFAAYPQELPRRIILGWCPPDGVVLDPFVGTGTTVMTSRALGRYGVGVDLSADYLRLARWRVYESGHAAKTMRRTWDERQEALAL